MEEKEKEVPELPDFMGNDRGHEALHGAINQDLKVL